jgi:DNA-binding LacI/PurR family transcriptional regulator
MKKSDAAGNLIEYLEAQLLTGHYPVGGKLPSLRSLARKFKISYSSAKNGIDYLEAQGKLRKSPRSGVFVQSPLTFSPHTRSKNRIVVITTADIALRDGVPGLFHSAINIIKELALRHDFDLIVLPVPNVRLLDPAVVEQVNGDCCGAIIMKELDQWVNALPITVPTVGVLMENDYDGKVSIVGIDPFNAGRQAVDYFLSKGKTKVHIVEFEAPSYRIRARLFELFFREAGGVVTGKTVIRSGEKPEVEHYSDDRGYFFTSDNMLFDCMKNQLAKNGENIIEQYCLLGIDGKSLISPWGVNFPTIAADWREIGKVAFEECLNRINQNQYIPRRIYLPGILTNPNPRRTP